VRGTCYNSGNTAISDAYGKAMIKFMLDAEGSWEDGGNIILTRYNLPMENGDSPTDGTVNTPISLTQKPAALLVQNNDADVKYIQITEITFIP
jgi:hypothetical protein